MKNKRYKEYRVKPTRYWKDMVINMNIQQIIILIAGAIFFTASFFIPEKKKDEKKSRETEERIIRDILQEEIQNFRSQMDDELNDAIEHGKEVTERYMDRITNEKMTAVSEYSDTVMEQIHKNHEEAVFLYDMLNNKHAQVKNTAAELNNTVKNVRQVSTLTAAPKSQEKPEKEVEKPLPFEPITPQKVELPKMKEKPEQKDKKPQSRSAGKQSKAADAKKNSVEVKFGTDTAALNSNDRILTLHKEGKSNMAIARELGLGIGEVKLVIDLFEGM